jgi:hypothetical protein
MMAKMEDGRIVETATEARQAERGQPCAIWWSLGRALSYSPSPSCSSSILRAEAEPARASGDPSDSLSRIFDSKPRSRAHIHLTQCVGSST